MQQNVAGIIPAAGAGHFFRHRRKISKLLAVVGGMPVIGHVVKHLKESRACSTIVVGKNHLYGDEIQKALTNIGHGDLVFIKDHWGLGTAAVLSRAVGLLLERGVNHGVMIFADGLFIRPETISHLVGAHLVRPQPVITMLTVPVSKNHPLAHCFAQYGVVKRDRWGQVCGTIERRAVKSPGDLSDGEHINPSVFVFNLDWVDQALPEIRPVAKGNGFIGEFHVTHLLGVASKQRAAVKEVSLEIPEQAVQINTEEDLQVARQLYQQQRQSSTT